MLAFTIFFLIGSISCETNDGEAPNTARDELQVFIRNLHPDAKILQLKDMDLESCGQLNMHPGLVDGDFNGDGRKDYAALLKIGGVKEEKEWEGKVWKLIDMWFVVFLGDGQGRFKNITIDQFETLLPSGVGISIQPPGIVREWDSDRTIKLRNPGIQRFFCEKSAAVFYWDGEKFRDVPISD